MKNDGILIKLDKELKDKFKEYCSMKKTTMTKEVLSMINDLVSNKKTDYETIMYESDLNFLIQEYHYIKNKIDEVSKITRALSVRTLRKNRTFYEKLLHKDFKFIKQFCDYQLLLTLYSQSPFTTSIDKFTEDAQNIIKNYSKQFDILPYHKMSAIAIDPIKERLVCFILLDKQMLFLLDRYENYENLLIVFILLTDAQSLNELNKIVISNYITPSNTEYIFYFADDLFPRLHSTNTNNMVI